MKGARVRKRRGRLTVRIISWRDAAFLHLLGVIVLLLMFPLWGSCLVAILVGKLCRVTRLLDPRRRKRRKRAEVSKRSG